MFSDVVYYHCSEFQIFLNGSHFSVTLILFKTRHDFVYLFLITANQNKLTSFSHILYPFHWLIMGGFPAKIDQSLVFPLCFKPIKKYSFKNHDTSLKKNRILMFVIVDGGTSLAVVLKKYHNKCINIQQVH